MSETTSVANLEALAALRALAPPENTTSPGHKPTCIHDVLDSVHDGWDDEKEDDQVEETAPTRRNITSFQTARRHCK